MWFGKNKEIGEANLAVKKWFSEEVSEQIVQGIYVETVSQTDFLCAKTFNINDTYFVS
ncbi:MAG: hypothetical protein GY777_00210 [Candidatus Brocadiaceae bacterium]|nr:hypothetical protein [Candidatus Brocadiaceae bacterium]